MIISVTVIWMWLTLKDSGEDRKKKHMPGLFSSYSVGDVPLSHLPTIIEH